MVAWLARIHGFDLFRSSAHHVFPLKSPAIGVDSYATTARKIAVKGPPSQPRPPPLHLGILT